MIDGVSICIIRETKTHTQPVDVSRPKGDESSSCKSNYIVPMRGKQVDQYTTYGRLVTIDPGRRNPYMALSVRMNPATSHLKDHGKKVWISKKWSNIRRFYLHAEQCKKWLQRCPGVQMIQQDIQSFTEPRRPTSILWPTRLPSSEVRCKYR